MCFRPSAVVNNNGADGVNTANCPTCGMSVSAADAAAGSTCPYCCNPIPSSSPGMSSNRDASGNARIL